MNESRSPDLSLVEAIAIQAQCAALADLRYIDDAQRSRLARSLEKVRAASASLREWNDALGYLSNAPPEPTQEAARERLIFVLSTPGYAVNFQQDISDAHFINM